MRIIGYLEHPGLKTTVFKMDNRLSVKFETGLYEQTYKFREGEGADTLEEVQQLINEGFFNSVLDLFKHMHTVRNQRLSALAAAAPDEFEEII